MSAHTHSIGGVIEPHGGVLVDRVARHPDLERVAALQVLDVDLMTLLDAEQLAVGTFSPLDGFMGSDEVASVLERHRTTSGVVWPLPIVLPISESRAHTLRAGVDLALRLRGSTDIYATISVAQIFKYESYELAQGMFGTCDPAHPGVRVLKQRGDTFVAGQITLLKRLPSPLKQYELTPREARRAFENKGWSRIVGFHTRNAPHRAHEYIQRRAFEQNSCDGIFIHPVVGPKKAGDYSAEAILLSYELAVKNHYPKDKVLLAAFQSYSRYAGPREAVFTALCRKNFGCSHFVVGRDHAGVGNYYRPEEARERFDRLGDIGITPVFFNRVHYCRLCHDHVEQCQHDGRDAAHISGTESRQMVIAGDAPPDWFMRPDVANWMIAEIKRGKDLFIG